MGRAVECVLHEPADDEPVGGLGVDAARLEVEALLGVDVPGGDAMAAAHVVGLDLEHRDPGRPGAAGEDEVAVLHVAVGALRHPVDGDQPAVDALGAVAHRHLDEQVAAGRRGPMGLE